MYLMAWKNWKYSENIKIYTAFKVLLILIMFVTEIPLIAASMSLIYLLCKLITFFFFNSESTMKLQKYILEICLTLQLKRKKL